MTKKHKDVYTLFKKYKYHILTGLILLLALAVRFYNFDTRWGIGNDDSRDVLIAQEALKRGELPMIGSFSSAGPFVFGPFFYWFIMLSYLLLPFILTAPWILICLVGVATVGVLMYCGKKIGGNNFALLVGLLAATSPQLVIRSLTLGQHTFVGLFTACTILSLLLLLEKKKLRYAFLIGLCIGAAINFHYQALNLLILLPVLLFIPKISVRTKLLSILISTTGILIALSPLIIWDAQQGFANFNNIFEYFLIGQYRLYVPNSWTLFLFTYLPKYWAFVVGGYQYIALSMMVLTGILMLFAIVKKKLPQMLYFLLVPFSLLLFLNRFYKGERSEGYLLYFLPFILLLTTYALSLFFRSDIISKRFLLLQKSIGSLVVIILVSANIYFLATTVWSYHSQRALINSGIDRLLEKYPDKKFAVYDYKANYSSFNQPLSLFLDERHLIDKDGMPIGILCYVKCPKGYPMIVELGGVYIADLRKVRGIEESPTWVNVNPANMYDDLIGWSKRHELRSGFSFQDYLTQKFLHF